MIIQILNAFEKNKGPIELNRLSRRLDIEPSALEGMLQTLVRHGKLREISPGSMTCTDCLSRSDCSYLQKGEIGGRVYELVKSMDKGGG